MSKESGEMNIRDSHLEYLISRDPRWAWLVPGLRVKRWLALLLVGLVFLSLGLAYLLRDIYVGRPYPYVVRYLTLQFLPRWARALFFGIVGVGAVLLAMNRLYTNAISPLLTMKHVDSLPLLLFSRKKRSSGPKVVAIGGGHGLSSLLRGLKNYTDNITAIVTVADDGGSSGKLRRELGILPPGDFRNCIAALSETEDLMQMLFQYRFGGGGLEGHSFGNLFLTAMSSITGSFESGLQRSSEILAVHGAVLPSTLSSVTLCAEVLMPGDDGNTKEVCGESVIPRSGGRIKRVYLKPDDVPAYPEALRAILEADMIVVGPGSLYTSLLPNLMVPDIARALRVAGGIKVYVCNVATQRGETDGFSVEDHVWVLDEHLGEAIFDWVVVNEYVPQDAEKSLGDGVNMVLPGAETSQQHFMWSADLADPEHPWRHDSGRLAEELLDLFAYANARRKMLTHPLAQKTIHQLKEA